MWAHTKCSADNPSMPAALPNLTAFKLPRTSEAETVVFWTLDNPCLICSLTNSFESVLCTLLSKVKKCYCQRWVIFLLPIASPIFVANEILLLFKFLTSFQNATESLQYNERAKASARIISSLFRHCRKAYLDFNLLVCISHSVTSPHNLPDRFHNK